MKIKCDKCGDKLKEKGALIFSPPDFSIAGNKGEITLKYHICKLCWTKLKKLLEF